MTQKNIAQALGLAFLTWMLSTHLAGAGVCPEGTEEAYSFKYGRNICNPDTQTLQACQNNHGLWDYDAGRCVPKTVKNIGKAKPKTSGGIGGGSDAQSSCESKGNQWNFQTGRCIKIIKKSQLPPVEQGPEQTQPDANTSGGVGGGGDAEAAAGPGHSPNGGGGGGDGD
jgi:hypothetical protein